jgi:hypothetical protein
LFAADTATAKGFAAGDSDLEISMATVWFRHSWLSQVLRGGALLFAIVWGSAWSPWVHAGQESESDAFRMETGGLMFGDLYHVASSHSEEGDGATGAVLRRGYLTFDAGFGSRWDARLRLEANQSGEYEQYHFKTDYKDGYVGLNFGEGGRQRLTFGLAPTPTFDLIETIWGRRYLARTPLDLQGIASRDTGVYAKGPLNASGSLAYRLMAAPRARFGSDNSDAKKWMGALTWRPTDAWTIDAYVDHESQSGGNDRKITQLFTAYVADGFRFAAQYSDQDREDEPSLKLASAFAVQQITKRTALVGRADRLFEPSPKGDGITYLPFDPSAKATFLLLGVEWKLREYFTITPNLAATLYARNDDGVRPDPDLHVRLTLFLNLE